MSNAPVCGTICLGEEILRPAPVLRGNGRKMALKRLLGAAEVFGILFLVSVVWTAMAAGRKPNVESLNLEACGILYDSKGIKTDANMRTSVPNIYAIGDVTGKSMLAHAATLQGKKALYHILGVHDGINLSVMPAAVFTCPEIASVGMTEEQCRQQEIPFKVLKSFFRANGKAAAMGETEGFCKLIVRLPDSGNEADTVILGCHIIGLHASDLVQEICVMMTFGMTLGKLRSVIHAHPTLSEVVMNVF